MATNPLRENAHQAASKLRAAAFGVGRRQLSEAVMDRRMEQLREAIDALADVAMQPNMIYTVVEEFDEHGEPVDPLTPDPEAPF